MRLDKWLWTARFFKSRALAATAVDGGKVELNGDRSKPGHRIRIGDRLCIHRGPYQWTIVVKGLSRVRGPAPQAREFYEETPESIATRATAAAQITIAGPEGFRFAARPSKKQRREISRFSKRRW